MLVPVGKHDINEQAVLSVSVYSYVCESARVGAKARACVLCAARVCVFAWCVWCVCLCVYGVRAVWYVCVGAWCVRACMCMCLCVVCVGCVCAHMYLSRNICVTKC